MGGKATYCAGAGLPKHLPGGFEVSMACRSIYPHPYVESEKPRADPLIPLKQYLIQCPNSSNVHKKNGRSKRPLNKKPTHGLCCSANAICTRVSHATLPSYIECCRLCKSSCAQKRTLLCVVGTKSGMRQRGPGAQRCSSQLPSSLCMLHGCTCLKLPRHAAARQAAVFALPEGSTVVCLELLMSFALAAGAGLHMLTVQPSAEGNMLIRSKQGSCCGWSG